MRLRPLRPFNRPDLGNHVIHFTGRTRGPTPGCPQHIVDMQPEQRLAMILVSGVIHAFTPYGGSEPVVCLTESTSGGVSTVVADRDYMSCGIAFTKDRLFAAGGGPALYVRGDEWDEVNQMGRRTRARATRMWPGAVLEEKDPIAYEVTSRSEWLHEREWRVLGTGDPVGFHFTLADVAFIVVPEERFRPWMAAFLEEQHPHLAEAFAATPLVIVRPDGSIEDPAGVWLT